MILSLRLNDDEVNYLNRIKPASMSLSAFVKDLALQGMTTHEISNLDKLLDEVTRLEPSVFTIKDVFEGWQELERSDRIMLAKAFAAEVKTGRVYNVIFTDEYDSARNALYRKEN